MKDLASQSESRCSCSALLLLTVKSESCAKLHPSLRPARQDDLDDSLMSPQSEIAEMGEELLSP